MKRPFLFWHIWRAGHSKMDTVANIQQRRLADLVTFARSHSPFYGQHYRQLPTLCADLHALPPVTKPLLMAHFDDWVTDTAVTQSGVTEFVADSSLVGQPPCSSTV
jgi:phenylacetate-coenzyme A ligase PaaK-like adenylate-forming protein